MKRRILILFVTMLTVFGSVVPATACTATDKAPAYQFRESCYYIQEQKDRYDVHIYAGQKMSSGYEICVSKVVYKKDSAIIYVKETKPPKGTSTLQMITYPNIKVRLKNKPRTVKVVDVTTKRHYKKLKGWTVLKTSELSRKEQQGYFNRYGILTTVR